MGSPGSGGNAGSVSTFYIQNRSGEMPPVGWALQANVIFFLILLPMPPFIYLFLFNQIVPSEIVAGDQFGYAVAIQGLNLIGGAPGTSVVNGSSKTTGAMYEYMFFSIATDVPTSSPTVVPDNSSTDDGWSSLSSFNNLAILLTVLGSLVFLGAFVAFYFFCYVKKNSPIKEPLLNPNWA